MTNLELYGGKRAYLTHLRSRALYAIGAYRSAGRVDWSTVARLVFVCQGNICRSPYAAARAEVLRVPAISFGLEATDGNCANESASRNALQRGIRLSTHRSARLQAALMAPGDLIVVFEPWQLKRVMRQNTADVAGATLLGIWARPIRPHIQDPYGRSDRYFQRCFSQIDLYVDELVTRLATHGAPAILSRRPSDTGAAFSSNSTLLEPKA